MDERPTPPPASPEDYGASELPEGMMPRPEDIGQAFDAVAEYTAPIESSRGKTNGAHGPDLFPRIRVMRHESPP